MRHFVCAMLAASLASGCNSETDATNTGDFEVCAEVRETARLVPVNLLLTVDRSGSMADGEPTPKWVSMTRAVQAFLENPAAEQLQVGLRVWPDADGCNVNECDVGVCSEPQVPVDALALESHREAVVDELVAGEPDGKTPMSAAIAGATVWADRVQLDAPEELVAIALMTDGIPNGCEESIDEIAGIAADAQAVGISTYVMGIEGSRESDVNAIARAGGTDEAFLVGAGNAEAELLEALIAIQGDVLSCTYDFPEGAELDPDQIRIELQIDDQLVRLQRVAGEEACAGTEAAWYLSSDGQRIMMCSDTCNEVRDTLEAQIDIEIGCVCEVDEDCPENERCDDNVCVPDDSELGEGRVQGGAGTCGTGSGTSLGWAALVVLAFLRRRGDL